MRHRHSFSISYAVFQILRNDGQIKKTIPLFLQLMVVFYFYRKCCHLVGRITSILTQNRGVLAYEIFCTNFPSIQLHWCKMLKGKEHN